MENLNEEIKGATFSDCRNYRYSLIRIWKEGRRHALFKSYALFIGLNPSTADDKEDDPTIRRCKRFTADWGYNCLLMTNLFAFRATKPRDMISTNNPVGPENDEFLMRMAANAAVIVCAWGSHGAHRQRDHQVRRLLSSYQLMCLGTNRDGSPKHPLYLKADTKLQPYGACDV